VHHVRNFLGLAGYYHRFILNFSEISKPISDLLTKEEKFVWNAECDETFQTRKKKLTTSPVLAQSNSASLSMINVMHLALGLVVFSCKKVT
jgi:hypothetical protein